MRKLSIVAAGLIFLMGVALFFGSARAAEGRFTVNLCTGAAGEAYSQIGDVIARFAKDSPVLQINVVKNTGGTWGNIERTVKGSATEADYASGKACHAFIGQPDGLSQLARENRSALSAVRQVASLHREYLHVLCSRESGVKDLEDLRDNPSAHKIALGGRGSGSWLVWQNFVAQDKAYGEVGTSPEGGTIALSAVATNQVSCMLSPSALKAPFMIRADQQWGDKIALVDATDGDFDNAKTFDGKKLYTFAKIPSGTYPQNLQTGFFGSKVETVTWEAGVYVNFDRVPDEAVLSDFISTVVKAKPGIVADFGK